ncbi:MAG: hypothetical protein ACI4J0_06910 [Huintestinicola sp.]|uniref:hypothetical protein n=1 Tax=Huintestinicola sp. TaxID=2981661 RepID=UPI003F0C6039
MALRGIEHFRANMFSRSGNSTSNQLASLLNRSSVNSKMLKKAYSKLSEKTGKTYLNRTDISENPISKYYQSGSLTETENAAKLKENAQAMSLSAVTLMGAEDMSPEKLTEEVKGFVNSYNGAVGALKNTTSYAAKLTGDSMTGITRSFESALSKAGITANEDGTLSVDEKALSENAEQAKTLFKGSYSYGAKMAKKGSELQNLAQLSGVSAAGIYNRYGIFGGNSEV